MTQPGGANQTTIDYASVGGQAVPKYAITAAPTVLAQTCIANARAGCRMLTFDYATTTGGQTSNCNADTSGENYINQLEEVDFTAYDPSISAMNTIPVACYQYNTSATCRANGTRAPKARATQEDWRPHTATRRPPTPTTQRQPSCTRSPRLD